jgi:peptidyl-prolyl cis-trans isomerase SurA
MTLQIPSFDLHRRRVLAVGALVVASWAAACRATPPPATPSAAVSDNVWAVVEGREITRDDVEKAYRRLRDSSQSLSDEEALTARLTVLNDLILQDLLIARARELKVEVTESELDNAYAEAKKSITDEAFQKELTARGLTPADMRDGLRRELITQKLIEQVVGSKIEVTAQEVSDFFLANRSQFNLTEDAYHIAQLVVTPVPDEQRANRTGDDAITPQAAAAKVKMLMEKLKGGASFTELALDYSEDPDSTPRGGDMGMVPLSRLKQAPPQLRDAVLNKKPGTVTVASMEGAHTLVLVVAHEPAGQRDLATPGMRDRITETLRARKEQLLRAAYLTDLRGSAQVVNHLARRLVESQGKLPGMTPASAAPAPAAPAPAPPGAK